MAEESLRHAAGRPTYEVRELPNGEAGLAPAQRFETGDYLTAVEYALDLLERRDPRREGLVSRLEIVRVDGSGREVVWTYPQSGADDGRGDLVRRWGYDVTRSWHGPAATLPRPPLLRRRIRPLRRA
jgi:hypothetical protein